MGADKLLENCAATGGTRPQAVLAVKLRQKALRQRFLIATTAYSRFPQPIHIRISPRYPISVH
jgi:hypothetical protein